MLNVKAEIANFPECEEYFGKTLPDNARFTIANATTRVVYLGLERSTLRFKKSFELSNNYLAGTSVGKGILKYDRAIPHHNLNNIMASWGVPETRGQTDLSFMEDQETGFKHKGMVPGKPAYPGKNTKKAISKNFRRYNIEVKKNNGKNAMVFLREAFREGYGLPKSKRFFYLHDGEFLDFREGLYQFRSSAAKPGHQFPLLSLVYAKYDKVNKTRQATHWMEISKNSITQADIDKIYGEEFEKAFNRNIRRNWRP